MNFSFLYRYRVDNELIGDIGVKSIGSLRHYFFALSDNDLQKCYDIFDPFPEELKLFYTEIGFGFIHRKKGQLNCLLDPMSLVNINLQKGYFHEDLELAEALKYYDCKDYLLFFRTNDLQYLAIRRVADKHKNSIWYKGQQVASSLQNFMVSFTRFHDVTLAGLKDIDNLID